MTYWKKNCFNKYGEPMNRECSLRSDLRLVLFSLFLFLSVLVLPEAQQARTVPAVQLEPRPGTYGTTQFVRITAQEDRSFQYRFAGSFEQTWIDYKLPLELSSLPGEERTFQLQVREKMAQNPGEGRSYTYVIDRVPPQPPGIEIEKTEEGIFLEFQTMDREDAVQYWISSFNRNEYRTWTGGKVPLENGQNMKAYSVDEAGNHSPVVTERIAMDRGCASLENLKVLSPVPGSFQNEQVFAVSNEECFEWIRFSTDGSDPEYNGIKYEKPVLLAKRGDIVLNVAAKKALDGRIVRDRIQFTVAEVPVAELGISGGGTAFELEPLKLPELSADYQIFYSFRDRNITKRNDELSGRIIAGLTEGMINNVVYRIGLYDYRQKTMYQYRSFFMVDRRIPSPPLIITGSGPPFRQTEIVRIEAAENAEIYYTTDGSTPDRFADIYRKPFSVQAPGTSELGAVDIQAVSVLPNGNSSEIARILLPFDRDVPAVPGYEITASTQNETVFELSHPEKDIVFIYALSYDRNSELTLNSESPRCGSTVRIAYPYGYSGTARIRFGAKDKAGNISQATAVEEVRVDTVPPDPPSISVRDLQMDMDGEGILYYKIDPLFAKYQRYEGAVRLETKPDQKVVYQLYGIAEDDEGNISGPSQLQVVYDRRKSSPVRISGLNDGAHYSEPVRILGIEAYPDSETYYTLSARDKGIEESGNDQNSVRAPDEGDIRFNGEIFISGQDKREIQYDLAFRSYIPGSDSWSDTLRYSFIIDRLSPSSSGIRSLLEPGLFNSTVLLKKDDIPEGEEVWLFVSEKELDPEDISAERIRDNRLSARTGTYINGLPSEEKKYYVYAAAYDLAGNSSVSGPYPVMIDRKKPPVPVLQGVPEGRFTSSSVALSPPEDSENIIVYEFGDHDSVPPVPTAQSPVLENTLYLQAEDEERTFYLMYRAMDQAGNLSENSTLHITIRKSTPSPPEPVISRVGGRMWEIVFLPDEDERVLYSISGSSFEEYSSPLLYELPGNTDSVSLEAYSLNPSGMRSPVISRSLKIDRTGTSLIGGVTDGRLYDRAVSISVQRENEDIRYELLSGQSAYPVLSEKSPRLTNQLKIGNDRDTEETYQLTVGSYDGETGTFHTIEQYNFTIDTAPPLPPHLEGIIDGLHYTEDQFIRITADEEGEDVYYSVKETDGPEVPSKRYLKPEKISVRGGVRRDFSVEMWTVDKAGNRSRTERVHFVIDKAGIYVSPDGRDGLNGGKDSPFKTLGRALYEAANSHRNTIYLSTGEYTISDPVVVDGQLIIKGGYSGDRWQQNENERTLISAGKDFSPGRSMFEINDGTFRIENLILTNLNTVSPVIVQKGDFSSLVVQKSLLLHANRQAETFIHSDNGNIRFLESKIEITSVPTGRIFSFSDTAVVVKDTRVDASDGIGYLELFRIEKGEAEFNNSQIFLGTVSRSVSIYSEDTDTVLVDSYIENGVGEIKSTVLRQVRGTLNIRNSELGGKSPESTSYPRIAYGIEAQGARITIQDSLLKCSALNGTVQMNVDSSSLVVENSRLENSGNTDFSYLLRMKGGSCSITDSDLKSGFSYDIYGIKAEGRAAVLVRSSQLFLERAENDSIGFDFEEFTIGTIQNSMLTARGGKTSIVVNQKGPGFIRNGNSLSSNLKLVENTFSGWEYLLVNQRERLRGIEELESEKPPFDLKTPHRGNSME